MAVLLSGVSFATLSLGVAEWQYEALGIRSHYAIFGGRLPPLKAPLDSLFSRLADNR
jgi:hypothetical protein